MKERIRCFTVSGKFGKHFFAIGYFHQINRLSLDNKSAGQFLGIEGIVFIGSMNKRKQAGFAQGADLMQIGKLSYHAVENEAGGNSVENEKMHLTGEHRELPVTDDANDNQGKQAGTGAEPQAAD